MKQILLSIILTLTCLQSHAQNITGIHTLRIGDDITKQLVEYELNNGNHGAGSSEDHGVGSSDHLL